MTWRLVPNKERRFGAAPYYWRVVGPRGKHLLLTPVEVDRAAERARANPEDLGPTRRPDGPPPRPWWRRLAALFGCRANPCA